MRHANYSDTCGEVQHGEKGMDEQRNLGLMSLLPRWLPSEQHRRCPMRATQTENGRRLARVRHPRIPVRTRKLLEEEEGSRLRSPKL